MVVAEPMLFASVISLIAFVCIPIPCTSGAGFNVVTLKSVLSKKSNTD